MKKINEYSEKGKGSNNDNSKNKIKTVIKVENKGTKLIPKIIAYNYFDSRFDLDEILKDFSLNEIEPPLNYNNIESFTKEVDKKIKKNCLSYIDDSFLNVLMIAEKPSIAKKITQILSDESFKPQYQFGSIVIYVFKAYFKGIRSYFTVTSVKGHIYDNKYEEFYDKNNPVKSYYNTMIKTLKNPRENFPIFLRHISKNKDILCLWIDCDPEGENICYEIIHNCLPFMNKKKYQQIYRAKFLALTEKDIKNAFNNLREYPNCKLSMSVDARSIIDYKVGISFSKLFTYEVLDYINDDDISEKKVLSYGPCQTPTLWFCVQRKKEIDEFIPSEYFKIYIEIKTEKGEMNKIYLNKEFSDIDKAKLFFNKIKCYFSLKVESIKTTKIIKESPEGLKTTTMLKLASSQLKMSPKEASEYAQYLYRNGHISYPRTSSTKYSPNFDHDKNLENLLDSFKDYEFYSELRQLYINFRNIDIYLKKGVEKGGHEPIIPLSNYNWHFPELNNLSDFQKKKLFDLICLYYFASLSPNMKYEVKEYKMKIGDYSFTGTSSKIIKEGFLVFQPYKKKEFISEFPELKENKIYQIVKLGIEKKEKESPDYLTESELIDEMEIYKIGTDGSIPSHINNLELRGYIKVDEKRRLIPTKLGIALINSLEIIDPEIIIPENRARIEQFVRDIEEGKKNYYEALEDAIRFYKNEFIECRNNVEELRDEFAKYFKMESFNGNRYRGKRRGINIIGRGRGRGNGRFYGRGSYFSK